MGLVLLMSTVSKFDLFACDAGFVMQTCACACACTCMVRKVLPEVCDRYSVSCVVLIKDIQL